MSKLWNLDRPILTTSTTRPRTRATASIVTTAIAVCLVSQSVPAYAMAPAGEVSEARANELFSAGNLDEAIVVFEALYNKTKLANYLFNIGRIHEEKGSLEEAIVYYERFMKARGVALKSRTEAANRVTALRTILDANDEEDGDTSGDETPSDQSPPADQPEDDEQVEERAAQESTRTGPTKLAIAGYSLLGVGGVALIGGGVVGGLAARDAKELDSFVENPKSIRDQAKRKAWTADGLFIAGGVFAAAGLTMVLIDVVGRKKSGDATARTRRLWLTDGPTLLGLGLGGRL